jgi:short-subunit dehydrogenase
MTKKTMFKNSVVWITGASAGLGREMAIQFAQQGATIVISARREDKLKEVLSEIEKLGAKGLILPCDVMNEKQIEHCVEQIIQHFGKLDIAIANAGFGIFGLLEELDAKHWRRQFDVNVTGLVMTAKYTIPHLRKTKGRLVLIGSVAGYLPSPKTSGYAASKAAVRSIGSSLNVELHKSGVSCTTIHPGFVDSEITKVDNEGVYHEEFKDPRPKNLMWPTDKAVRVMLKAIYKRKHNYVFTGHGKVLAFIGQYFPGLARRLMLKLSN